MEWDRPEYRAGRVVRNQRWRSGVPLGGLGCGKVELLTDGALGNFTGNHNWDRPTGCLRGAFFALRSAGRTTLLRLRRWGEYDDAVNVADVEYNGFFPRALVRFGGLGLDVELEAFSPLMPHNVDDSALPVAFFTFRLRAAEQRDVTLLFSWENVLGVGGRKFGGWDDRTGNTHQPVRVGAWSGLRFTTTAGKHPNCTGEYLTLADGPTTIEPHWDARAGMIARSVTLTPGQEHEVRFLLAWHLPRHEVAFDKRRKRPDELLEVDARAALGAAAQDSAALGTAAQPAAPATGPTPAARWTTNPPTIPGEQLLLDLGAAQPLDRIVLDNTCIQGDFTATLALESSADGRTWEPVPHGREAVRAGVATFLFEPRTARHYRVTQTGYGPDWKWNVARVAGYLGETCLPFVAARARVHREEFVHSAEDLGHWYQNRFDCADALAAYAIEHRARLDEQTRAWQNLVLRAEFPAWLKVKLLNHSFPAVANSILTRDGRFTVAESPVCMDGACGTMDQRQASHAFWLMMFPELDRRELELYAACQERVEPVADGRIPHFCGNFHNAIGDPMVEYGTTDWPDLSCSWIMQVVKHFRWTGDRGFARRMWPHVKRALAWLAAQDTDGDLIPEGGSTYDYEHMPRGAYIFTASVYLGALRAADELARVLGEPSPYAAMFEHVQEQTLARLYDEQRGTFIKWAGGEQRTENTFIAPLAGDWFVRLTGLEPIFPPEVCESALRAILGRHVLPFRPVPPMEVTPAGAVFTPICFVLQHEPYVGCEAIYQGFVAEGLEVVRRVYEAAWDVNWSPWDCPLNIEAPHGRQSWLKTYMTATATWHVLPALAGTTLDLDGGVLHFEPRAAYHGPLFFPTFWAWLDCEEGRAALRVDRVFQPGTLRRVNHVERELPITPGAVWDLSDFARLPRVRHVPAALPVRARPVLPPWGLRGVHEQEYDVPPIRMEGAIDGDPVTCWTTDRPMQPGDWFEVDLRQVQELRGVRTLHASDQPEYPRGLRVEVSKDGASWQTVAELSADEVLARLRDKWLPIEFHAAARYIRLIQLGESNEWRWSIHEFELLP